MRTPCENILKKQKLSLPTFTVKMQEMEKQETPPQGKAARHRNIAVDPCGRCKDLSNIRPTCNPLHSALGVRRFRC